MSQVRVAAPAKINLTLEVVGRRSDGYHALASILVAVNLEDEITLEDAFAGATRGRSLALLDEIEELRLARRRIRDRTERARDVARQAALFAVDRSALSGAGRTRERADESSKAGRSIPRARVRNDCLRHLGPLGPRFGSGAGRGFEPRWLRNADHRLPPRVASRDAS